MADSAIEEIKRRLDAVDLISQTVELKRSGKSFKGLCPFHGEKTPSFHVWPDRGSWHCFGCGEGGDLFSFVMRRDNLEFPDALRHLAERAGVEIERAARPDPTVREKQDRLHALLASAALYYRGALAGPRGAAALRYLQRRGLTAETTERFGLGYAEPTGRGLAQHLTTAGFTIAEAVEAGALGEDEGRVYDRFRDRIVFPIRDVEGRVIGFGGRALSAEQQPKYLNTAQTTLFDKGGSLYALDEAKSAVRDARQVIVVEGYMDALAAHQHGFCNVVATLGTAITERHVEMLRRLAPEIVLALDDDAAGTRAAIRGSEVANQATADESPTIMRVRGLGRFFAARGTQIKVMVLSGGRDPDDLIREDPGLWRQLVAQSQPAIEFLLRTLGDRHDVATTEGRRAASREAMAIIQDLPDPVERAHYIQRLARLLDTREEFLLQAAETGPRRARTGPPKPDRDPAGSYDRQLEDLVLALLLRSTLPSATPDPADFDSAEHRAILDQIGKLTGWPDVATAIDRLRAALGEHFVPALERLVVVGEEIDRLSSDEVDREIQVRALELRKLRLFRQHHALDSVLREEAEQMSAVEQHAYHERLNDVAARLGEVFAAQHKLGSVGTASWSIRRGQEVVRA